MSVKNFLFSRQDDSELSRTKIFPIYTNQLRMKDITRQLDNGRNLDDASHARLMDERNKIKALKPNHGMLFKTYLQALESERPDMVAQVLELVEAQYGPRVQADKEEIRS